MLGFGKSSREGEDKVVKTSAFDLVRSVCSSKDLATRG